jgi:hypothetical protein
LSKRAELRRQDREAKRPKDDIPPEVTDPSTPVLYKADAHSVLHNMDITEERCIELEKQIDQMKADADKERDETGLAPVVYMPEIRAWINFESELPDWHLQDLARRTPSGSIL